MIQSTKNTHTSFYGMKLCGREFIRAVIFTCGGSRWRRSIGDAGKTWGCSKSEISSLC
uniref:Insulin-like domain-containing protein n=1 Tax=Hippocampus comes TaxID=109280 RepID=A0A3Q2YGU0_HIPCM